MHVTWIGWLFLSLTPALLALGPRRVYLLMVFFIPFSATAVVNAGTPEGGSGIQPYIVLGTVWILLEALAALRRGAVALPKGQGYPLALLSGFALIGVASLAMPLIINGAVSIVSPELLSDESIPLRFTWRHITQGLYLVFAIIITTLIAVRNANQLCRIQTLRVATIAAVFVSAWGWVQWLFYLLGVPYPAAVFNNSITKSALGYDKIIEQLGVTRISSVAVEPSIFAQYLLTVFPFLLLAVVWNQRVLSRRLDAIALLLVGSALLISTSASAYIGLALTFALATYASYRCRTLRVRHLATIATCAVLVVLAYSVSEPVRMWVSDLLLSKTASYSGAERVSSVIRAWGYFAQYPLLGVGWGSVTSHDLVVKLLANTGLLGLASFSFLASYVIWRLRLGSGVVRLSRVDQFWHASLFISTVTLLVIVMLTGFSYVFGHMWFVFGLAIAVSSSRADLGDSSHEVRRPVGSLTAQ